MFNSTCPLFHPLPFITPSNIYLLSLFALSFCFPLSVFSCTPPFALLLFFPFPPPCFPISMFIFPPVVHPTIPHPPRPPRESSERAWGSTKCGSTSWREMQYRLRRLREISLNSTRLVSTCVSMCVQLKLGTDAPIISLISRITLWGSDSSHRILSQSGLFHQASGYFPYSGTCGMPSYSAHYATNLKPQSKALRGS